MLAPIPTVLLILAAMPEATSPHGPLQNPAFMPGRCSTSPQAASNLSTNGIHLFHTLHPTSLRTAFNLVQKRRPTSPKTNTSIAIPTTGPCDAGRDIKALSANDRCTCRGLYLLKPSSSILNRETDSSASLVRPPNAIPCFLHSRYHSPFIVVSLSAAACA